MIILRIGGGSTIANVEWEATVFNTWSGGVHYEY